MNVAILCSINIANKLSSSIFIGKLPLIWNTLINVILVGMAKITRKFIKHNYGEFQWEKHITFPWAMCNWSIDCLSRQQTHCWPMYNFTSFCAENPLVHRYFSHEVITDGLLWAPIVMEIWWLSSALSTFVRFWTGYHCWRFPVTEHQTDGGENQRLPVSPGNTSRCGTLSRLLSPSRPRTLRWQQAPHKTSACYVMALYYGGIVTWCAWISPLA